MDSGFDFSDILLDKKLRKKNMKIVWLMTSRVKLKQVRNHCILGSIK